MISTKVLMTSPDSMYGTVALVVTMEDEKLHNDDHPFCNDLTCPCHRVIDGWNFTPYYQEYIQEPIDSGLLTYDEAMRIYHGDHF